MSEHPTPSNRLPDAAEKNLAQRLTPPQLWPFVQLARLDRPVGWQLLLAPCWWSSALASIGRHQGPNWSQLLLFLLGAMLMRGAGSTYNDIVDRHIDAKVARTRGRPLPSGRVSVHAAKVFLVMQAFGGLLVLLAFNRFTIGLGIASLAIVAVYPFMKRITSWPQLVLGFAFAWGGLMGWAGQYGALSWAAVSVYVAAIVWTIGYDTIYALQDSVDDAIVGVRSTARLFGGQVRLAVALFYGAAVALLAVALILVPAGIFGWLGLAGFAGHLAWQVSSIRPGDNPQSLKLFRSNRDAGLLLFGGLVLSAIAGIGG